MQSLTISKTRKKQSKKLSQLQKAKTCWTKNWWSSGIMSNFGGQFFYVLKTVAFIAGKKNPAVQNFLIRFSIEIKLKKLFQR